MKKARWHKLLSLKVLAAILLFGSWVTQNYYFNAHDAKVKRIELYNLKRDSTLSLANSWWMAFIEIKNQPNVSTKDKFLAGANFLVSLSAVVKNDLDSIPDTSKLKTIREQNETELDKANMVAMDYYDTTQLLKKKDSQGTVRITKDELKKLMTIKEYKDILPLANALENYLNWTKEAGQTIVEELEKNNNMAIAKAERSNLLFLFLYIAGAFVAGLGYVFEKK